MQIGTNNHKQVPTLKFGLHAVYNHEKKISKITFSICVNYTTKHENGNCIICKSLE